MKTITLKEARAIMGHVLHWQFVTMGLNSPTQTDTLDKNIDLETYSLQDFITANKKVSQDNARKRAITQKSGKGTRKFHLTLDDRLIAAFYVCLNYKSSSEIISSYKNIGCKAVTVNH